MEMELGLEMEKNCRCSLCGSTSHTIAFHSGFVCESCIDYIRFDG